MRLPAPHTKPDAAFGAFRGAHHRHQRGLAALTVVMAIFFVLALVAAYTNRNVVFEQRMAAGSQRAERAIAVADGAVDWALAMLNGGRIDSNCQPSTDVNDSDFRSRYLGLVATSGAYSVIGFPDTLAYPGCKVSGTALNCVCPKSGDGDVAIDAGTDNDASFRVSFLLPGSSFQTPAGTVLLQVRGCSNAGSGGSTCYGTTKNPGVDAKSDVRANVGLLKALAAPPQSTLTAGGSLSAPGVTVRAANRDNPTGLVLHVGSAITIDVGTSVLQGPPGSSGANTKLEGDAVLAKLKTDDRFFESLFGMERALFKRLPGALSIPCAAGCKLSDLDARNWLTTYAGKVVYVDGDLTIDESGAVPATIGSNSRPAMLVVNGKLTIAAPIELIGFFYGNSIDWTGTAAGASVRGALISANDVTADATMTLTYDSALLEAIRLGYGSYVRVPGGWNRGGI